MVNRAMHSKRKILIAMMDGFSPNYLQASEMPNLKEMIKNGFYKTVNAVLPTVTNVNNTSICTGVDPTVHGITANSYFNVTTKTEEYMDKAELVLAPTIFERAQKQGMKSALLTAKGKTQTLLKSGADIGMAAEFPSRATGSDIRWTDRLGAAPEIYSAEINHWLLKAVQLLLDKHNDVDLIYYHTTDFPMHMEDHMGELSQFHLREIDKLFGEILNGHPDLEVYLTADHGMNFKSLCHDLNKYLPEKGLDIFFAMSAERDPYIKHHRNFGGTAYLWLNSATDFEQAADIIRRIEGVENLYSRYEASSRFHLHPDRIGDMIVIGDKNTVFGPLDQATEDLPNDFRTHGSLHEASVPMVIYNRDVDYSRWDDCTANYHLTQSIGF